MLDHIRYINQLAELGLSLTDEQLHQFDRYYELLIEWNSVMNLTSITEYEEVVDKHFIDSIALYKVVPDLLKKPQYSLLDLGTGAGFPGIPLKIVFPDLSIVLMDSLNKRVRFLNEVIEQLKLTDIKAVHARAEEAARKAEYREKFDLCVSRAVARLCSLAEFCIPFVKNGGCFIPYKSGKIKDELEEAKFAVAELGGSIKETTIFKLPQTDQERAFVRINKNKVTPAKYPRAGGKPLMLPLVKK